MADPAPTSPWNIPLFGDGSTVAPIQDPLNAQSVALNTALNLISAQSFARYVTRAAMLASAPAVDQHATVYADPTPGFNGDYLWRDGATGWRRLTATRLGRQHNSAGVIVAATPSWTDVCTLTATSSGGPCSADWTAHFFNSNSGAARTVGVRITCDGTQVEDILNYDIAVADTTGRSAAYSAESTPAAGAHTWKLQANASVNPAINFRHAALTVTEY